MARGRRTSIIASAAIFIVLEIAALALLGRSSSLHDIWINRASQRTLAFLWGGSERLRDHFHLREQNDALARQNAELQEKLRAYRLAQEAEREDSAMVESKEDTFRHTAATIVKMSRNSAHNYVILDKGSEDGIVPQSGIITDKGVVGIISAVGRRHSYGLTLMNGNISVSARVGRQGVCAMLSWDGISTDGAVVNDIPPHYEIAPGDTVWTSGYSSIFPADIPIGITGESRLIDGAYMQVDVRLTQDFRTLRYVTVTENKDRREMEALAR